MADSFRHHKGVSALYALATGWDMSRDPPQELRNGRAHSFNIAPDGTPSVDALNILLAPR